MLIPNNLLALGSQNALRKRLTSLNSSNICLTTVIHLHILLAFTYLQEARDIAKLEIGEIYRTDLLRNLVETRWPKLGF